MKPKLHLANIRDRLNKAFDESELTDFCFDYFPSVYDQFAQGMRKNKEISLLLGYCRRHPTRVQALLDAVRHQVQLDPYRDDVLSPLIESLDAYLTHLTQSEEKPSAKKLHLSPPLPLSPSPLGIGSERICPKACPDEGRDGMVQVYVPAGKFLMGSRDDDPFAEPNEKPQHEVYLDAYWIDKTPVTNAMFAKFVADTGYVTEAEKEGYAWGWIGSTWALIKEAQWRHPSGPNSNLSGKDNHPVVSVSWNDAVAYAKWAERRLPTEAEWEKAAGGTDERKWPWGNNPPTEKLCNFDHNVGRTTPVDKYPDGASPYGALDMVGNVWEWCNDNYDENYYASSPKDNPPGPRPQGRKVLHGGSWYYPARDGRVRLRVDTRVDNWDSLRGFRCAESHL